MRRADPPSPLFIGLDREQSRVRVLDLESRVLNRKIVAQELFERAAELMTVMVLAGQDVCR